MSVRLGRGCRNCSTGSFRPKDPAILYYILDIITDLYKIGITNQTVKERFGTKKMKEIKILGTWSFKVGKNAYNTEQALHKHFKEFQVINENFTVVGGKTEFFKVDILNLNKA